MQEPPYLPAEPLPGENWFRDDPALRRVLATRVPAAARKDLEARLDALGSAAPREIDPLSRVADARPPTLAGNDVVLSREYLALQRLAREHEVFTLAWREGPAKGSRLATFLLGYLYGQAECGYYCPACMTDGAAYVLARHAGFEDVVARLVQKSPEGAFEGAMFLTEPQGGSDLGATSTRAEQAADGTWRLTGHKWFASNANAEAILTLARMPGAREGTRGLGLFLLLSRGNPGVRRVALKDKLGVRSMATAEVRLEGASARLVAGEGEGFKAMAEMVNLSRLYNAVASVAIARRALREAQKNGAWRQAFGKPLAEQPLYRDMVAGLANDVAGAFALTMDCAEAFDHGDRALMRALTPLAKAGTARMAVEAASAACEALGGNGYVAPWITERLLRDAQVLPIWEGTTNVQALDFLRGITKEGSWSALHASGVALAPALRDEWDAIGREIERHGPDEARALAWLERCYHLRAASLLARDDPLHARAYLARRVRPDADAWIALARDEGAKLAGWA
ncbi:MAG: acyl-CoA dehydrogenase [Thermoplasmata archaeon]|jgi:acyl-CoA dehydrogenase|nr:acyl-CoA dehydrogenase [Thermoplasmata archaeon]